MDYSGNQTVISYITFRNTDGSYLVTAKGGKVEGEGGTILDIPDGALVGPTVVKITQVQQENLPHPVPNGGVFLGALNVDTGGIPFQKEVHLSIPAPNLPAGAVPFLAQPQELVSSDGTVEKVYAIIDSTKVINGRLTTASPPYDGPYEPGTYVFEYVELQPVILDGYLFRDVNQNSLYDSGVDLPIRNAVVRSPEAVNYVARTNSSGHYAVYSWAYSNTGTCRDYRVIAADPYTQISQNFNSTLCEAPYLAQKDFVFPFKASPTSDKEPPRIQIDLVSDKGFVSGVTPLGAVLTINARISDNVEIDRTKNVLKVEPQDTTLAIVFLPLQYLRTETEPVDGTLREVLVYNATYQPQVSGPYTVQVSATDLAAVPNTATRAVTFSVTNAATGSLGVPGAPRVLEGGVSPYPDSKGVEATAQVEVYFSEPVNNVNNSTFTLNAVASLTGDPAFTPSAVGGNVVTGFDEVLKLMKATFIPDGNLQYSTRYKITLTPAITDADEGKSLVAFSGLFETKIPDTYGLASDWFAGRDVALLGDFAYVAANESGWKVVNIVDPENPVVVSSCKPPGGGVIWNDRGVATAENAPLIDVDGNLISGPLAAFTEDIRFIASGDQYSEFRLFDVSDPKNPRQVGHERLGTDYSGIPGRLKLYGGNAYICTASLGLQVVDLLKAQVPHEEGDAIVGFLDTISEGYTSPVDLAELKGNLYLTTMNGYFLSVDISDPTMPYVAGKLSPTADFRAVRLAVAGNYNFRDPDGVPQNMDIALVSSSTGKLNVINITDPTNPRLLATLSGVNANDIVLNANTGMAYISSFSGVMVIDIKNPAAPRIISNLTNLGSNPAIVEKDGFLYTANQVTGLKVVELNTFPLKVDDDEDSEPKELKFGDGTKPKKTYHLELVNAIPLPLCASAGATIKIVNKDGVTITNPIRSIPAEYRVKFVTDGSTCKARIVDQETGVLKSKIILSNANLAAPADMAVLYGGLGNKLKLEMNGGKKVYPIELVGVIILGIDGLRQDVLYNETERSYNDPTGCGGVSCYINPAGLTGLKQILRPDRTDKTIKLPGVSAIFPSITFASWASIFSGKPPKETGIMGNEFFARDLYNPAETYNTKIPGLENYPSGMVTLDGDGGALKPDSRFFPIKNVLPLEFTWNDIIFGSVTLTEKLNLSAPKAATAAAGTPIWSSINEKVGYKYNRSGANRCDQTPYECATVSVFNQYAAGVDWWVTPTFTMKSLYDGLLSMIGLYNEAAIMDESAVAEAKSFIRDYFAKSPSGTKKRFPALFSVYLAGPDHQAHLEGMGEYTSFITNTTDKQIDKLVTELKAQDEFDNKIFVIVADHGHTAMPMLEYPKQVPTADPDGTFTGYVTKNEPVESSCKLKLDGLNNLEKQLPEIYNNSLHIWELAKLFTLFPSTVSGVKLKLLTPKELEGLKDVKDAATSNIEEANIIAAMNGPMAHIYVKGVDWHGAPNEQVQASVLNLLKSVLKDGVSPESQDDIDLSTEFPRLFGSLDKILVRAGTGYVEAIDVAENPDHSLRIVPSPTPLADLTGAYVDIVKRVADLNSVDRSGDIILIMKDKTTDKVTDRYTTGYACKSWHGSLNPSDSFVPLILSYPGGNSQELQETTSAVCTTARTCTKNWVLPDLIKNIIVDRQN